MFNVKSFRSISAVVLLLSFASFTNAAPPPTDQRLLITSVEVKDLNLPAGIDTLIIHGMNFMSGKHDPIVTLHGVGNLFVPVGTTTEDTITAEMPNGAISPGDYLLSISTSPAVVDNDTYALTVGGGVDTSGLQDRVSGNCVIGSSIRAINEDGSVECEIDDDTKYTAGFGLVLVGNEFSMDSATIQQRVSVACPDGYAIKEIKVDGGVECVQIQVP